jgi:hypothetical protein
VIRAHDVLQVLWLFLPAYVANMSPVLVQGWFVRLWPVFDQLDFFAGAYLSLSVVYAAPPVPTLACLPAVLAGSVAVTAIGWALGLKEAWI